MKKSFFPIILFFLALTSFPAYAQELLKIDYPIRVVTYNIRFDNPADGPNVWANRKEKVANLLRFYQADIFCLQEALFNQIEDLEQELPEFDYYGVGRDDGKQGGESCPVFYNKSRFKVIENGTFWLSETPEKAGSIAWYATLPRLTTWIKFRDLSSGKDFFVFNTHLDHSSQTARDNGSRLIKDKINQLCGDLPVILTGDFNDRPGTKPYNNIISNDGKVALFDAKIKTKYPHQGSTFTFVGWDFIGIPGNTIDYIFVNSKVDVTFHANLGVNYDGIYPSDHIPVFIQATLK